MTIRLTYPVKSHDTNDLRPLYEEFKRIHPDIFNKWHEIEVKDKISGPEELQDIHMKIREFLKKRVEWESNAALTGAFADFRRLIAADILNA